METVPDKLYSVTTQQHWHARKVIFRSCPNSILAADAYVNEACMHVHMYYILLLLCIHISLTNNKEDMTSL
jgi:hypothetical protein